MSNYPTVRPSLTLDFQKSKQLDPRISFSRSSSATYVEGGVVKTADEHQARFEDEGLLLEESRANLLTYSEQFDNAEWVTTGVDAPTVNSTTAPNGELTADTLTCNATNSFIYDQINGLSTNTYYAFSVFVKKGTADYCYLSARGHQFAYFLAVFDLSTGICTQQDTKNSTHYPLSTNYALESIPLSNGWFRLSIATKTPTYSDVRFKIGFASQGTGNVLGNDGISGATPGETMFVWGAQVEQGSFPTSYIPTSGSTVIRAADVCKIEGDNFSSWYNQSEGTLTINATDVKEGKYVSSLTSGTTGSPDTLALYRKDDDEWRVYHTAQVTFSATGSDANFASGYSVSGSTRTASAAWKGSLVSNVPTDASSIPFTSLQIGTGPKTSGISNGHISRLSYYSERLTNTQLEAITL